MCDLFEWSLRCGEADTLHRLLRESLQSFERERQVRAALGRHERVDFVDDDRLDAAQAKRGFRSQQ
jgi:hypothetical protein